MDNNIMNKIGELFLNDLADYMKKLRYNEEMGIRYIIHHYIDKPIPFGDEITKNKLRYRGIRSIVYGIQGECLGIIQRDSLITFSGYKVPYRNGHFYFEEQAKINN